ncbi:MAG: hypothetical protein IJT09_05420 [Abditibacteriota bacterium]|nr:hypothetical protein [Abditibacteriota bacterium]
MRGARLADTVHLEFLADRDIAGYEPFLSAAAERLAAIPGVEGVSFRHRSADWSVELAAWSDLLPRLHSPEVLRRCDPEAAAARTVAQLALPLPGGARRLRETPFALELPLLRQLAELERAAGLELSRELPFFATRDRRRAMIVLEAGPLLGEAAAIRELFRKIDGAVGNTPPGLRWRIVSGGSHTLGNEAALKRDAAVSGAVSLTIISPVLSL